MISWISVFTWVSWIWSKDSKFAICLAQMFQQMGNGVTWFSGWLVSVAQLSGGTYWERGYLRYAHHVPQPCRKSSTFARNFNSQQSPQRFSFWSSGVPLTEKASYMVPSTSSSYNIRITINTIIHWYHKNYLSNCCMPLFPLIRRFHMDLKLQRYSQDCI